MIMKMPLAITHPVISRIMVFVENFEELGM
jgi:hypothetical protein